MPASLAKDELALLCLPDLEKLLLVWGGSKRRENILIHYHRRLLPSTVSTRIGSEPRGAVDSARKYGAVV
jgi:hypothetical protein